MVVGLFGACVVAVLVVVSAVVVLTSAAPGLFHAIVATRLGLDETDHLTHDQARAATADPDVRPIAPWIRRRSLDTRHRT
jgi:hypothetical protein